MHAGGAGVAVGETTQLRRAVSSLLAVHACLIDIGSQIAATVPEEKRRSIVLLGEISWQGKACGAEKRAREELPSACKCGSRC